MRTAIYWIIMLPPTLFLMAIWVGGMIFALPVVYALSWLTRQHEGFLEFTLEILPFPMSMFWAGHKMTRGEKA